MKLAITIILMAVAAACEKSDDCIDENRINKDAICTMDYRPVCGCDEITYGNACQAENAGVTKYEQGECFPSTDESDKNP